MISKVELKKVEYVEVQDENGEIDFKEQVTEKKIVPCVITNYSLKRGKDENLIDGNILQTLIEWKSVMDKKGASESDILSVLNETDLHKVIYVGIIGANPATPYSFDDFVQMYHGDMTETVTLYSRLIMEMNKNAQSKNGFAKGLADSTKKEKKKRSRQKLTSNA